MLCYLIMTEDGKTDGRRMDVTGGHYQNYIPI